MRSHDVLEVLDRLDAAGVTWWVDGGWGVDALFRRATRAHGDLDLVVPREHLPAATDALAPLGLAHAEDVVPGLPGRLVLRDPRGRQVDLHVVVLDADGNAWQELDGGAWGLYPRADLAAEGAIAGRAVRCVSAELQLRHRLGYPWRDADQHDLRLLRERFGLALPPGV